MTPRQRGLIGRSIGAATCQRSAPLLPPWHLPRPDGTPGSPRGQCSGGGGTLTPHRASSFAKRRILRAFGGFPASTAWSIRTASFRRLRWSLALRHSSTRQVNPSTPSFGWQPACGSQIPVRHGPSQTEGAPAMQTSAVPLQWSPSLQASLSVQLAVAGAKPSAGQSAVVPVQVSATSHGPAAGRQTVPAGWGSHPRWGSQVPVRHGPPHTAACPLSQTFPSPLQWSPVVHASPSSQPALTGFGTQPAVGSHARQGPSQTSGAPPPQLPSPSQRSSLTPLSAAFVILPSTITLSPGPSSSGRPASLSTLTVSPQVGPTKRDCSIRLRRALAPVMATVSTWQGGFGFGLRLPSKTSPRRTLSDP